MDTGLDLVCRDLFLGKPKKILRGIEPRLVNKFYGNLKTPLKKLGNVAVPSSRALETSRKALFSIHHEEIVTSAIDCKASNIGFAFSRFSVGQVALISLKAAINVVRIWEAHAICFSDPVSWLVLDMRKPYGLISVT